MKSRKISSAGHTISRREREVLELISLGYTTKEIANLIHLSAHTIISHRKNLLLKCGASNLANLMRKSFEMGLMQVESKNVVV